MRIPAILLLSASPAAADPGHLASSGGHDHLVAGVAIGAAIALAAWQILKGALTEEDDKETEETPESGESPA